MLETSEQMIKEISRLKKKCNRLTRKYNRLLRKQSTVSANKHLNGPIFTASKIFGILTDTTKDDELISLNKELQKASLHIIRLHH